MTHGPRNRLSARSALASAMIPLAVLISSCGGSDAPVGTPSVSGVTLDTGDTRLLLKDTLTVGVTVMGDNGAPLVGKVVSWRSSDVGVLSDIGNGRFEGVAEGTATVTAAVGGVSVTVAVEVFATDFAEELVQVDDSFELISTEEELAAGTLRYSYTGNPPIIDIGDVLMGVEDTYLRKVVSITQGGGEVIAQTVQAAIPEAVDSAVVIFSEDFTLGEVVAANPAAFATAARAAPSGISIGQNGRFVFDDVSFTFDVGGDASFGGGTIAVNVDGSLAILLGSEARAGWPTFFVDARVGCGNLFKGKQCPRLKEMEFNATAGVDFQATVTSVVTGDLTRVLNLTRTKTFWDQKIFPFKKKEGKVPACAWAGPICYSINLVLDAYVSSNAEATATLTQEFTLDAGATVGFKYTPQAGFTNLNTPWLNFDAGTPEIQVAGSAGLRFGVRPKIEVRFFEVEAFGGEAGSAAAGLDQYLYANANADLYSWSASTGVATDLFVEAEISLWDLIDALSFSPPALTVLDFPIGSYQGELARLELSPDPISVLIGETKGVGVTAYSLITGTNLGRPPLLDWGASPANIVTVNASGGITGVSSGAGEVWATIRGAPVTDKISVVVAKDPMSMTVDPGEAVLSRAVGQTYSYTATVTSRGTPVANASILVTDEVPGVTLESTITTDSNGEATYTGTVERTSKGGVVEVRFGPVEADDFAPINEETTRFVQTRGTDSRLRISSCVSVNGSGCADGADFLRNQSFFVLFGADAVSNGRAQCGTSIPVRHPFTGVTTTFVTEGSTCLGSMPITVPSNAAFTNYLIFVGPATRDEFDDGAQVLVPFNVIPPPVASVTVSPASASVEAGTTQQFTATPRSVSGETLSGRVLTWTSSNTGVATITSSGLVTGVAAGTTTITAATEGISGTATVTVTVTPPVVASVTVSPSSPSAKEGQTQQLTSTARTSGGGVIGGRATTWQSSNPSIASVSSSGLVSANVVGTVTITATTDGISGSVTFTVTDGTPPVFVSSTPVNGAIRVPVDADIVIRFNEPMDPASIQINADNNLGGFAIGSKTWNSDYTVVTFNPVGVLAEFGASYGVTVGGRDSNGNSGGGAYFTFTTEALNPNYIYRITNEATGTVLTTVTINGGETCALAAPASDNRQNWFMDRFNSVRYSMSTLFGGNGLSIEAAGGDGPCFLTGSGSASGQRWEFTPTSAGVPVMRLNSASWGASPGTKSLGLVGGVPWMQNTSNAANQRWRFTFRANR
jgi:uncharacterized protein YjdB